jgi:hypothetical protein
MPAAEVYNMQFRPVSELAKESFMRDAKEEGKKEGKKTQLAIAKKLFAREMPVYDIVAITGLSEKSILALKIYFDIQHFPKQSELQCHRLRARGV